MINFYKDLYYWNDGVDKATIFYVAIGNLKEIKRLLGIFTDHKKVDICSINNFDNENCLYTFTYDKEVEEGVTGINIQATEEIDVIPVKENHKRIALNFYNFLNEVGIKFNKSIDKL